MEPIDLHVIGRDRTLLERVAELLVAQWDPRAEFEAPALYLDAAGNPRSPEDRRSARAHAEVILAMFAAGGPETDVVGYLRRAEEAAFGTARTTASERWALASRVWRWSHGHESLPTDGGAFDPDRRQGHSGSASS